MKLFGIILALVVLAVVGSYMVETFAAFTDTFEFAQTGTDR